ncbi:MAG: hypothetical protein L3J54_00060 [Draconibacterium sp.]|nr:hypothetical protein [Draconibacterium sp.]
MKKQILFLTMFTLALIFAGTSKVFGQKVYDKVPTALPTNIDPHVLAGCTADELHPVQGQVYTYTVNATAQTDVRWFVVNNNDVIANGDSIVGFYQGILPSNYADIDPSNGTGNYIYGDGTTPITGYNVDPVANATGQYHSIDISWKYFDGITDQVILVAYAEDSVGCTNNLEVYRIIPTPAFTLDIAVLSQAGDSINDPQSATTSGECVSLIESAIYAGGTTTPLNQLTVDYGENWVYYIVNGANYIDSWQPKCQISYAGGTAPTVEASWAYLADARSATAADWNTLSGAVGGTWTSAVPVIAGGSAASAGTVGAGVVPAAGGEAIVVRVRLDWGTTIEHDDALSTLTFAVDGIAYDGSVVDTGNGTTYFDDPVFGDLHYANCTVDGFTNDVVDYEITPRPEVENAIAAPVDTEDKTGDETN